jgi:catechol 2,3-dioxygenase-like lactoylglutathione lyase family enzyme
MATPRSLLIVIYVPDMAEAVAFYRDGLALPLVMQSSGWSMLACGEALIGLHLIERGVDERPVPYAGLNLLVDDLEGAIHRAVAHGATLVALREPDRAGLPRLGVLLAPGGNGFELRDR